MQCRQCNGTGFPAVDAYDRPCSACDGSGVVPMFHPGETVEWVTMTHPKDAQRGTVESAARGTVTVVYGPFDDRLTLAAEEAERFLTRVAE